MAIQNFLTKWAKPEAATDLIVKASQTRRIAHRSTRILPVGARYQHRPGRVPNILQSSALIRRSPPAPACAATWPDWRGARGYGSETAPLWMSAGGGGSSSSGSTAKKQDEAAPGAEGSAAPSEEKKGAGDSKESTEKASGKEETQKQEESEEQAGEAEPEEDPPHMKLESDWRQTIQADGVTDPNEGLGLFDSLMKWVFTKQAVRHCRNMAPADAAEGRFDNVEGDIEAASPEILKFLRETLTAARDAGESSKNLFQTPAVEEHLAARLEEMVTGLREEGRDWTWEIDDVVSATCDHLHVIIGHSRSRPKGKADVLVVFRQHLVMQPEQSKRFFGDNTAKRDVLLEMLLDDFIVAAVVRVVVRQRSALAGRGEEGKNEEEEEEEEEEEAEFKEVEHILRLELPFTQDRIAIAQDEFNARAGEWQLVDWNDICDGNHPVILPTASKTRVRL